ncbi:MAG TPA: tetratricopeptide repeat protein [Rhizomicrobium sp.]|nr:tetratricopeptide repeat protein [Rhizomicrobium sp.]
MPIVLILIFAAVAAVALGFACWPLWRSNRPGRAVLTGSLALFMIAIAAGAYILVGHPDLAARSVESPDAKEKDARALVTTLAWRMRQNPGDPRGWYVLGRGYLYLGDAQDAAAAFKRAIPLTPPEARPAMLSTYGEALMLAAQGMVTPDAEAAFRAALADDPKNFEARYYLGEAYAQRRDAPHALALWRALLADSPPDAPWRRKVADRIALLSALTEPPPDPSVMVANLAARLKRTPNDPLGWQQLVKSYVVLGQPENARTALADARRVFAADKVQLAALDGEAKMLKLEK